MATYVQYRVGVLIWAAARLVEPIVYIMVWSSTAAALGGNVGTYDRGRITAYFIAIMIANQLTFAKMLWRYELRIQHGALSYQLMHPVHVFHRDLADNLASKALQFIFVITSALMMTVLFQPDFDTPLWAVIAVPLAIVTAWMLNMVIDYLVAMSAFWVTRTNAIDQLFYLVLFFFSGRLAPLDLLPDVVQLLANALPFRWILAFPAELMIGQLTPAETAVGFAMQALWLTIGAWGLRLAWRSGVRHYSAVGG